MWIPLTPDLLLTRVAAAERAALARAATAPGQEDVLSDVAAQVAAEWRGGLRRVCPLDRRPDRVPDELAAHILADYRYRAFTRLPGMGDLLDALRVDEWKRACQVRDSLAKVSVQPPGEEWASTPAASGKPGPSVSDRDATGILG